MQVWFCVTGTITCYQHPSAGVAVNSSTSLTISNVGLDTGSWQFYLQNAAGLSARSASFTVQPVSLAVSGYNWNTTPTSNQPFGGTITGSGFVSGARVFFCFTGTVTCYEHPSAGITVNSSTSLTVSSVNLGAGSWQFYIQTPAGLSGRSSSFSVGVQGSDAAAFVGETIADGSPVSAGQPFTKTWTVRNSGTTTWNSNYRLRWVSGAGLSSHADVPVSGSVAPGATYTFSVPMTAPTAGGTYREDWKLVNGSGAAIQVGGSNTIWVVVNVAGIAAADKADFVSENYPDGWTVPAAQPFTKTWTVRNSGTTTWTSSYRLRWVSGAGLSNHADIAVSSTVPPGASYSFSVAMMAPNASGSYRENWKLINGVGGTVLVSGSDTIWVSVRVNVGGQSSVAGSVTNPAGGALAGATVQIAGVSTLSDSQGKYSITGIAAGDYTAMVSKSGYGTINEPVSVPANTQAHHDFKLSPAASTTNIAVTSVTTKYRGKSHFLNGVTHNVTFTVNVNWGGHPPSSVHFITPKGTYIILTSTSVASKTFDVGSEFGTCGKLRVKAVSGDGTSSAEMPANFVVMSPAPYLPASILRVVDSGDSFQYELPVDVTVNIRADSLSKTIEGFLIPGKIPFFGQNGVSSDYTASVKASVDDTGKSLYGVNVGLSASATKTNLLQFAKGRIAGQDYSLTSSFAVSGSFMDSTCQWGGWSGLLGVNGDVFFHRTFRVPQTFYLVYFDGGFGIKANTSIKVANLQPFKLDPAVSEVALHPYLRGHLGGGYDKVGAVEGGLTGTLDFKVYPSRDLAGTLTGEYKIVSKLFHFELEHKVFQCSYTLSSGAKGCDWLGFGADKIPSTPSGLVLYQRNYLDYPGYATFHAGNALMKAESYKAEADEARPLTSIASLQTNVFPLSDPSLSAAGNNLYLVWLNDDPTRAAINRSVAVFSSWNGATWSNPAPIADDGTGDFQPQVLGFTDGLALAVWEDAKAAMSDAASVNELLGSVEISASLYNPSSKQWSSAQRLSSNGYLDRNPLIAGQSSDDTMLVWVANERNDARGSETNPNKLWSSRWNGSSWTPPQSVATVPYGIVKYDLTYGAGKGEVVLSLDTDNDQSTDTDHELFSVQYQNGAWGGLTRLTNDAVLDDNPRLGNDLKGNEVLVWMKGDEIYSAANRNIDGRKLVAAPGYSTSVADFKLSNTPDGRVALLWAEANDQSGSDLECLFYDAALDVWGGKKQLTADSEVETNMATAFYGGNLITVYNRTGQATQPAQALQGTAWATDAVVPQGPTDLFVLTHTIGGDLAIKEGSFGVSPRNPRSGEMTTVNATVINQGDTAAGGVSVSFYLGDPSNGGTLIGRAAISNILLPGNEGQVSLPWTPTATSVPFSLYVVVDPDKAFDDINRANNTAGTQVIKPDLAIQSMRWERQTDASVLVTARVVNLGSLPSKPTAVTFRRDSPSGAVLASPLLGAINPDQSVDISFPWDTTGLDEVQYLLNAGADEGHTVDEYDEANNTATLLLTLKSDTLFLYSVTPATARSAGGQQLKLTGLFDNLSVVKVDGQTATWSYANGTGEISVTAPPHAVGAVAIELISTAGVTLSIPNAFAYLPTSFTDNELTPGVTTAKAKHITELREAIDALRAVAGLPQAQWTDFPPKQFITSIKVVHVKELRTYLEEAALALGYAKGSYTDPDLSTQSSVVRAVHIKELRLRIIALAGECPRCLL